MYETLEDRAKAIALGERKGFTYNEATALDGQPAVAFVNYGRWVVTCPDCNNGIYTHPDRGAWCCNCGNTQLDGMQRPVTWPAERDEIEAILASRPQANQHWTTETLAELLAENADHGVG